MGDIVQEIIDAAKLAKPFLWEPDHPQYVDGKLHLTQEQWDAVCREFPNYDRQKWAARPYLAWGIHVEIVTDLCPECGRPGKYGLNTTTWSFDRCPRCWWPGK